MTRKTKKTAHLLVTCCIEPTRFDVLKQVVASLESEKTTKDVDITDNLWVIDNGSQEEPKKFIAEHFSKVFWAEKNYGFWSAINWFLDFLNREHPGEFEYIHIIESDHVFFALEKLLTCEDALDKYPTIGSIRCQEFVVSEAHLYDKDRQSSQSRSYAWVRQIDWDGTRISFTHENEEMQLYSSKLVPLLHSVNRLNAMNYAFKHLAKMTKFSEQDFQKLYREQYYVSGLIDGGLFHTKLTWNSPNLSASWSPVEQRNGVGYRDTRHDFIVPLTQMTVT